MSDDVQPARSLRLVMVVLAFSCGATVANLYYPQPLLDEIAAAFSVSQGAAALVVTLTQLGYAAGMALLMPLGDLLENRKLAARTLVFTTAALLVAGLSPVFGLFLAASVLIGLTSVVAQILIPFAAHLAPERERGRFVGTVMTGLLLGILLARTVSSLVAAAWGWRTIYLVSAALMLLVAIAVTRLLPHRDPGHDVRYRQLMRSVLTLVREEPALRRRAGCQALMFGAFSAFWTTVAFELTRQHGLSQTGVGVFALVGAAGAAAAPIAGRLGDRGHGVLGSGAALALGAVAMVVADLGVHSVVALAVAGVLLDLAVQGHQVLSQQEIYGLRADARARINTVFMTTIFVGGAVASAIAGALYDASGWTGSSLFGAALPVLGLGIWGYSRVRARRDAVAVPASG
ncbi:putative MFS family arabinose efflux permease [Amycolatopsis bartoniae]|uniref:MFS transporter n=1 Tax=Amycolatopsis bartoniae TaxID=941986 RepID=A0A8H9IQC9_9PSEU|nr:MFS transporter [Amycolatopsis bartoniae]MBB2938131.1 putative MFS family arabinose efflux permease [Amycolatopsis bartoniae]TVS99440.1 MFS transporter [Amycolatopsis bartoniae]GHF32885.1 MFS transporter [Amycolatopsis bartoniae]